MKVQERWVVLEASECWGLGFWVEGLIFFSAKVYIYIYIRKGVYIYIYKQKASP